MALKGPHTDLILDRAPIHAALTACKIGIAMRQLAATVERNIRNAIWMAPCHWEVHPSGRAGSTGASATSSPSSASATLAPVRVTCGGLRRGVLPCTVSVQHEGRLLLGALLHLDLASDGLGLRGLVRRQHQEDCFQRVPYLHNLEAGPCLARDGHLAARLRPLEAFSRCACAHLQPRQRSCLAHAYHVHGYGSVIATAGMGTFLVSFSDGCALGYCFESRVTLTASACAASSLEHLGPELSHQLLSATRPLTPDVYQRHGARRLRRKLCSQQASALLQFRRHGACRAECQATQLGCHVRR